MDTSQKTWWHLWDCERCRDTGASEDTRQKLLAAAFEEIHHRGFQSASLQNILKKTDLTKGALYHHFKNKQEIGYAVVDEILKSFVYEEWVKPLEDADDPIQALMQVLQESGEKMTQADIELGCPLNNLSQEMSGIDEGFRLRIESIYKAWQQSIKDALERGKVSGYVREDVNSQQFAVVFIATLEGCIGMAKSSQSMELLMDCGMGLIDALERLRVD